MTSEIDTRITSDETALIVLRALGYSQVDRLDTRVKDGLLEAWIACPRCSGKGHLGRGMGPYAWQTCFRCQGARGEWLAVRIWARRARNNHKARIKAAAKAERKYQAKLERQRDWCEANGFGRITFEEKNEIARAQRKAEREAAKANLEHVGQVKDRVEFTDLELVWQTSWSSDYGTTILYKFRNADGNLLVWKSSTGIWHDGDLVDNGVRVTLKATIKEHTEYKGEKQTMITRAKVSSVEVPE